MLIAVLVFVALVATVSYVPVLPISYGIDLTIIAIAPVNALGVTMAWIIVVIVVIVRNGTYTRRIIVYGCPGPPGRSIQSELLRKISAICQRVGQIVHISGDDNQDMNVAMLDGDNESTVTMDHHTCGPATETHH